MLVIGMVGAGTIAQWTSTATSTGNTFSTGTLTLELSNDYVNWSNGVSGTWTSPAGWAPGESFTSTIYLRNTGSVDAMAVYTDWDAGSLVDTYGLSNYIEVTQISDSTDGYSFNAIPAPANIDANSDGKISLAELATWSESALKTSTKPGDIETTGPNPYPSGDPAALPAGGTLGLRYTFKLMDETPNGYQGTSCTINVVFLASQTVLS